MEPTIFSIIIPAHNEEGYIGATLRAALGQGYPQDKYEVIVSENGSTDATLEKIKAFDSPLLRWYTTDRRGISLAKNIGATKARSDAAWLVFLDADTLLDKSFLSDLDAYLRRNISRNPVIGTARLRPIERSWANSFWFWFCSSFNHLFKKSASIQIARRDLFDRIGYDEELKLVEDMMLIRAMRKHGRFFFLANGDVRASARRFAKFGALKLIVQWAYVGVIPYRYKKERPYDVIR